MDFFFYHKPRRDSQPSTNFSFEVLDWRWKAPSLIQNFSNPSSRYLFTMAFDKLDCCGINFLSKLPFMWHTVLIFLILLSILLPFYLSPQTALLANKSQAPTFSRSTFSPAIRRRGPGDIGGFRQRRRRHSARRPGGGAIAERAEPAEEEAGPDPPPRSHRGRRRRRRRQGRRVGLRLVAPTRSDPPSADQEGNAVYPSTDLKPFQHLLLLPPSSVGSRPSFAPPSCACNPPLSLTRPLVRRTSSNIFPLRELHSLFPQTTKKKKTQRAGWIWTTAVRTPSEFLSCSPLSVSALLPKTFDPTVSS